MADDAPGMDVDEEEVEQPSSSNVKGDRKRFEVKKVIPTFHLLYQHFTYQLFPVSFLVECSCLVGLG
jgi:hypothetical protein